MVPNQMASPKLELWSFPACPYVQRALILLKLKGLEFGIRYIDLESPPADFLRISPEGRVPVLLVDGTPVFESLVILQFLDEISPPALLPANPLARARERAWMEYSSGLLSSQFGLLMGDDPVAPFFEDLGKLEPELGPGPFFGGERPGLMDAAIAPLFARMSLVPALDRAVQWQGLPRIRAWAQAVLALPSVRDSVPPDFAEQFRTFVREHRPGFL